MKKFGILFAVAVVLNMTACAEKKTAITVNQLPQPAQTLLTTYFSDLQVAMAVKETEMGETEYIVSYTDATQVKFNKKGEWKEVDRPMGKTVPDGIVPEQIRTYVATTFPNTTIQEIDKDRRGGYDVKLSNRMEIEFNDRFLPIEMDD